MQSNDARTLLQCAVPTALVGVVAVVVSSVLAGGKGGIGAVVGTLLAGGVMATGLIILNRTARHLPHLFQAMGLALYLAQCLLVAVFVVIFKETTLFNTKAFAFSLLAATLAWIAAQTRTYMKAKILYVDPESVEAQKSAPTGSPS
ncbi:hypothetical protein LE181_27145 [Streptomyces sp. SCA3-4]|uniref:hypothetical protein n=1 Tax=Streptomyces sichuanensis TaxID=2871810 RepID=UPI001CE31085|nr:hypothetical protein [Streptomyces sichuanensis]MCA6095826.1 hypothetical protein [Streptomyces sichuanensis]